VGGSAREQRIVGVPGDVELACVTTLAYFSRLAQGTARRQRIL
jgi:hypothetical protein